MGVSCQIDGMLAFLDSQLGITHEKNTTTGVQTPTDDGARASGCSASSQILFQKLNDDRPRQVICVLVDPKTSAQNKNLNARPHQDALRANLRARNACSPQLACRKHAVPPCAVFLRGKNWLQKECFTIFQKIVRLEESGAEKTRGHFHAQFCPTEQANQAHAHQAQARAMLVHTDRLSPALLYLAKQKTRTRKRYPEQAPALNVT